MSFLDQLERRFGRFCIHNLTLYIIIGQVFVVLTGMLGTVNPDNFIYVPELAREGQWWRMITFVFITPIPSGGMLGYVFLVFGWWVFYFMGNALEAIWGAFKYNLFLGLGWALTVGLSFLAPTTIVTNAYLGYSLFLAFAYLNPEFEMLILFVIPVKVRWLAVVVWVFAVLGIIQGSLGVKLQIAAAAANIILFFGRDIWSSAGYRTRRVRQVVRVAQTSSFRHQCTICKKTDISNPELDFRYCSKCAGDHCYCSDHIFNHEHLTS